MKLKSLLFVGVLAIFTLSVAAAKTYGITFTSTSKVGTLQLKAGDYRLQVDGNKITFIDAKRKSFTTDGKVENSDKSFGFTRMDSSTEGDTTVVKDIEVGGSKLKIDF
jgi:hypothetical protein